MTWTTFPVLNTYLKGCDKVGAGRPADGCAGRPRLCLDVAVSGHEHPADAYFV